MTVWRAGMKATLIEPDGTWFDVDKQHVTTGPNYGEVVTVTDYMPHENGGWLWFAEWSNDQHYDAQYFRPVVEYKTDISIFTAMLSPSRQPERERV